MCKVVIIHVDSRIRQHLSEVVGRTYEEIVAYDVRNHLLVQVSIRDLLPVRVLKKYDNNNFKYWNQIPLSMKVRTKHFWTFVSIVSMILYFKTLRSLLKLLLLFLGLRRLLLRGIFKMRIMVNPLLVKLLILLFNITLINKL